MCYTCNQVIRTILWQNKIRSQKIKNNEFDQKNYFFFFGFVIRKKQEPCWLVAKWREETKICLWQNHKVATRGRLTCLCDFVAFWWISISLWRHISSSPTSCVALPSAYTHVDALFYGYFVSTSITVPSYRFYMSLTYQFWLNNFIWLNTEIKLSPYSFPIFLTNKYIIFFFNDSFLLKTKTKSYSNTPYYILKFGFSSSLVKNKEHIFFFHFSSIGHDWKEIINIVCTTFFFSFFFSFFFRLWSINSKRIIIKIDNAISIPCQKWRDSKSYILHDLFKLFFISLPALVNPIELQVRIVKWVESI